MSTKRLDKYLADAGVGTRSQVKTYIKKGMVSVNGKASVRPEMKIDSDLDVVTYNNVEVNISDFEYYLLNKPAGYVSAAKDNINPTVLSLLNVKRKDLFPVGRLDKDTEGLLIITNNGEFSHRLLSPKHHVDKTYYAVLDSPVGEQEIRLFADGLEIGDEDLDIAMPAKLEILDKPLEFVSSYYKEVLDNIYYTDNPNSSIFILITINEGKYHQVKRMFQKIGRKVLYLRRMSMGEYTLPTDLEPGQYISL